jgi:hypothetical protein
MSPTRVCGARCASSSGYYGVVTASSLQRIHTIFCHRSAEPKCDGCCHGTNSSRAICSPIDVISGRTHKVWYELVQRYPVYQENRATQPYRSHDTTGVQAAACSEACRNWLTGCRTPSRTPATRSPVSPSTGWCCVTPQLRTSQQSGPDHLGSSRPSQAATQSVRSLGQGNARKKSETAVAPLDLLLLTSSSCTSRSPSHRLRQLLNNY